MLDLKKISTAIPYSDDWWKSRLTKMTSSTISCICGKEGIGVGGYTYIRKKVYEHFTGVPSEKNVTTEDIVFGIENEPLSLELYKSRYGSENLIQHKHIIYNDRTASTPDAIDVKRILPNGYDCETVETKSFKGEKHIQHCECDSPADIKKINSSLYWQVIHQMYCAEVLVGNAVFFNPHFKSTDKLLQHRVVFKKIDLLPDFTLLKSRLEIATAEFDRLVTKFKNN